MSLIGHRLTYSLRVAFARLSRFDKHRAWRQQGRPHEVPELGKRAPSWRASLPEPVIEHFAESGGE